MSEVSTESSSDDCIVGKGMLMSIPNPRHTVNDSIYVIDTAFKENLTHGNPRKD